MGCRAEGSRTPGLGLQAGAPAAARGLGARYRRGAAGHGAERPLRAPHAGVTTGVERRFDRFAGSPVPGGV